MTTILIFIAVSVATICIALALLNMQDARDAHASNLERIERSRFQRRLEWQHELRKRGIRNCEPPEFSAR